MQREKSILNAMHALQKIKYEMKFCSNKENNKALDEMKLCFTKRFFENIYYEFHYLHYIFMYPFY